MRWCDDPYGQERKGRDAARWGERYDPDHRERMRNASWESDSCDTYYARGYKREIRRREDERREEECREEARERDRHAQWAREEAWQEACREQEEQENDPTDDG